MGSLQGISLSLSSLHPDIVFVTLFCIAVGTAVAHGAVVAAQCRPDTALVAFCYSGGGPRQPWSSGLVLFRGFTLLSPLFPLVPVPVRPTRLHGRWATKIHSTPGAVALHLLQLLYHAA